MLWKNIISIAIALLKNHGDPWPKEHKVHHEIKIAAFLFSKIFHYMMPSKPVKKANKNKRSKIHWYKCKHSSE